MQTNRSDDRDMGVTPPSDFHRFLILPWPRPRLGALLFALSFGCGGGDGLLPDGGKPTDGPTTAPTFAEAQAAALSSCGGEVCHTRAPYGGGLSLATASAFQDLVNVKATANTAKVRVKPGDPDNSFLWQKLNNKLTGSEGGPMPKPGGIQGGTWSPLPADKLQVLRNWIAAGAKGP